MRTGKHGPNLRIQCLPLCGKPCLTLALLNSSVVRRADAVVEGLLPPHQKRTRSEVLEAAMAGLDVEAAGAAGRPRQRFRRVDTISWSTASQQAAAQGLLETLTAEESLRR